MLLSSCQVILGPEDEVKGSSGGPRVGAAFYAALRLPPDSTGKKDIVCNSTTAIRFVFKGISTNAGQTGLMD
jgi:hypothetical protein